MRLFFETGEYAPDESASIPEHSQAREALGILQSWNSDTQMFTINTSGTTGEYKSIPLTRDLMEWSARQTASACRLGNNEKEFCCLPLNKIGGMMQVIRSAVFDRDLMVVDPIGDPMTKLAINHNFTLTSLTPYQFYHIFESDKSLDKLSRFKVVLLGGGPIHLDLEDKIERFEKWVDTRFYHTYGMTETSSHIALRPITYESPVAGFKPLPGVQISRDEDDCMLIHIPQLNTKIQTHDMIQISKDGFSFLGRKDNIINSGGLKIIPETLEHGLKLALYKQGLNFPFYFKGVQDEALGQKCVLVMREEDRKHEYMLHALIQASVEEYQRPKSVEYLKQFKYTRTNKLIRL